LNYKGRIYFTTTKTGQDLDRHFELWAEQTLVT